MRLKDWRELARLTYKEVADGIGVAIPGTVEKHEKGFSHPSPELQAAYREFTKGAVTPDDWLAQYEQMKANPPQRNSRVAICGTCERRESDPEVQACTDVNCPMRMKEAG